MKKVRLLKDWLGMTEGTVFEATKGQAYSLIKTGLAELVPDLETMHDKRSDRMFKKSPIQK